MRRSAFSLLGWTEVCTQPPHQCATVLIEQEVEVKTSAITDLPQVFAYGSTFGAAITCRPLGTCRHTCEDALGVRLTIC